MTIWTLSLANLRNRPLSAILTILLLSLGCAVITVLLLFQAQFNDRLQRDTQGIDLVVGAKGSPLQLILSTVYQLDAPTGNIPADAADFLKRNRLVENTIPLAMGDAYRGARIIGTNQDYLSLYSAQLDAGRPWQKPLEVVLGSRVAADNSLSIDDQFSGAHGISGEGDEHAEHPYRVVGVLKPTGSVIDRLILTSPESVWQVHAPKDDWEDEEFAPMPSASAKNSQSGSASSTEEKSTDGELTAILVQYKNPLAAALLPRQVNQRSRLQAASPAYEVAKLFRLLGIGIEAFHAIAAVLVFSAALSMFIALYNALQERQSELALLRTLGAGRMTIFWSLVAESAVIALCASLLGLLLGHLALEWLALGLSAARDAGITGFYWLAEEAYIPMIALLIGFIAALIPAIRAYRLDIAQILARQ